MISIMMTPFKDTETFKAQYEAIKASIGIEYEVLCTVLDVDPMAEWFREYTFTNGIRAMLVPDLGAVNLINLLGARAKGKYIFYIPDIVELQSADIGWGKRAVEAVNKNDSIGGAILSATINDPNAMGLLLPIKTFHIFGYYCCPIFETPIYGFRWNASILTELNRLVNVPCGITYKKVIDPDLIQQDCDIYNVTRSARLRVVERVKEFMEKAYDRDTTNN